MKRFLVSIASTASLLLLACPPAWADSIASSDVQWTYNFTPSQPFVSVASPGTGSVTFTNEPTKSATNTSDVVLTNLRASSTALNGTPDTFNSTPWSGSLTLTDTASGASTTMNFSGQFGGYLSAGNSNVTNAFTGTQSYSWTAPNGNQYTVALNTFTPPGPPTASNYGSISAHVTVTDGQGTISNNSPEPSTLLLSCLGLGFAGVSSWRKRRAKVVS